MDAVAPGWDPYDEQLDDDPYPTWAALRDHVPVYRNDRYDFWALSRFHDVEAASKDVVTFSSAKGTVLERMGGDLASSGMMIFLDPPEHSRLRTMVSRALTPRRVAELEVRVRTICAELLDPWIGASSFDYVQDVGAQLPSRVISSLMGVPPEDQEEQRRHVEGMFHIEPGVGMANDTAAASAMALVSYLHDLVKSRRSDPTDDLASALVSSDLDDEECTRFALLLYTAGTETVSKLLGNAAVLLAGHPEQRADMAARPEIIPNAVEEVLRYEPPSPVNGRWTTRDVVLHGTTIPAGSKVLLLTGSAGRDERAFDDPDRFDVNRQMQHHLTFGYGIHFCLGAALARLEGRVALEETLRRFPTWELGELERVHTSTVRGYGRVQLLTG